MYGNDRLKLSQMRSADRVEQCPLSGATEKTFAHPEFFSGLAHLRHWQFAGKSHFLTT
jgi:hypothetical protein